MDYSNKRFSTILGMSLSRKLKQRTFDDIRKECYARKIL
jgi:hypothetical protein